MSGDNAVCLCVRACACVCMCVCGVLLATGGQRPWILLNPTTHRTILKTKDCLTPDVSRAETGRLFGVLAPWGAWMC